MNRWIGVGRIYHTPQMSYAGTPRRKLRISVVTSEVMNDGTEEKQFHNVVLPGALCDLWGDKLLKTDLVGIDGKLVYHKSKRDGAKRVAQIEAESVKLLAREGVQYETEDDDVPF